MWGQKYFGVLNELSKSSSISYDLFCQNLNSCLFTLIQTHFRKIPKIIHLGENLAKYIHGLEVQNISNITAIYIWELCAGVKALYYDKQKYIFLINGIFVKKNITLQYRSSVVWIFFFPRWKWVRWTCIIYHWQSTILIFRPADVKNARIQLGLILQWPN